MGTVELIEYVVKETEKIRKGQTIAIVKNWWAMMALKAVGPGYVTKTFFERGTHIKEGDPMAIIVCDSEDGPRNKETCGLEIIETIRHKPSHATEL